MPPVLPVMVQSGEKGMSELSNESRLLIKLLEEKVQKVTMTYRAMAEVSITDSDRRFFQGKAEGGQTALDILKAITTDF